MTDDLCTYKFSYKKKRIGESCTGDSWGGGGGGGGVGGGAIGGTGILKRATIKTKKCGKKRVYTFLGCGERNLKGKGLERGGEK